jgi:hypothetical protein
MKRATGEPTGDPIVESQIGIPNALFVFAEQFIKTGDDYDSDYIIFPEMFCNFYILFFIYLSSAFSHILKMLSSISFQPRVLERDARDNTTAQIDLAFKSHQQKLKSTLNDLKQLLDSGIGSGIIHARNNPFSHIFTELISIFYTKPIDANLAGSLYEIVDSRSKSVVNFLASLGYGNSSETLEVAVSHLNLCVFAYCRRIHHRVPQTLTLPGLYYSLLSIVYGDKRGEFTFNFIVTDNNIEHYARQIIEQAEIQIQVDSEIKIIEKIIDSLKKRKIIIEGENDDLVPGIIGDIETLLAKDDNNIKLFNMQIPRGATETLLLKSTPNFFKICMVNLIMRLFLVLGDQHNKALQLNVRTATNEMMKKLQDSMVEPSVEDFKDEIKVALGLEDESGQLSRNQSAESVNSSRMMDDETTSSELRRINSVGSIESDDYVGTIVHLPKSVNTRNHDNAKVINLIDSSNILGLMLDLDFLNSELRNNSLVSRGGSKKSNRKKPVSRHFNGTRKIMNKPRKHIISKNLRKKQNKKTTYKNKNQRKKKVQ